MTRKDYVSEIYRHMTGTPPPETLWKTPSGQKIAAGNPALLYNQPTSNLYQIIRELSEEDRTALFAILRAKKSTADRKEDNCGVDDEHLLIQSIKDSALSVDRLFSGQKQYQRQKRYQKPHDSGMKETYLAFLRFSAEERRQESVFWRTLHQKSKLRPHSGNERTSGLAKQEAPVL